jgi:GNAT superfamily N-acetyltransferase
VGTAVIFREARRDDIAALHRVRMAVRENRLTSTVLAEDDYIRALEPPSRTWLVAADGDVVAFAAANAATGNIWALFVDPDHEGRGYGRQLHDAMVAWLWEQGTTRAWLTTTPGTRAHRFYEAAGWRLAGAAAGDEILFELSRP